MARKLNKAQRPSKKTLGITFRGVSVMNRVAPNGKIKTTFRARVRFNQSYAMGKTFLGYFGTPELAAEAYNKAVKKLFGQKTAKKRGLLNEITNG
jgi:cellulose biosynthesis protein BcsQ